MVVLSSSVPKPNSMMWVSKSGITLSCVVLLLDVVSLMRRFVSSSSRSIQRQISSIFYFRDFLRVDFGLIPKNNPTLTFVRDWNLIVLIQVRFLRNVSKMPLVELYFDSYLSWDTIYADSGVNGIYICFVILHSIWSRNKVL